MFFLSLIFYTEDATVIGYVDQFYQRMVAEKRFDVFIEKKQKKSTGYGIEQVTKDRLYAISSKFAKFGRSKEKCSDTRLVVMGLVISLTKKLA